MAESGITRRQAMRRALAAAGAASVSLPWLADSAWALPWAAGPAPGGQLWVTAVSRRTIRLTLAQEPTGGGTPAIARDNSLLPDFRQLAAPARTMAAAGGEIRSGGWSVRARQATLSIRGPGGEAAQLQLAADGSLGFPLGPAEGHAPVFGLGEGGRQMDRRGAVYRMRHGEFGPELRHEGARVSIPWLMGDGWALLVHQPHGTFDLTGGGLTADGSAGASGAANTGMGWFHPHAPRAFAATGLPPPPGAATLDFFWIFGSPAECLAEYCRLTGLPEMPPRWALGYQQSHRTIWSREVVMGVAATFRRKRLPCDVLIYLGTGFCPSGWNTANGSFDFNPRAFPDPAAMIAELHREHFKVVLHAVILADKLEGHASDPCNVRRFDDEQAGCYWDEHRKDFALGVDGWWADEGDRLDARSDLNRIRMYWQGEQLSRPHRRPYVLTRNGYAGMQRFAPLLWSGDITSEWETLRTQVANGLNTGLSGVPYWGTDTGGFVPMPEFTAELFVRWFQFSAFCPLFRGHGRAWELRLPWGWDMGTTGPPETRGYRGAALPPPSALHNTAVEPICRRYLDLRYRLLPYIYSAVYQAHSTGLPPMRALCLHYGDDPRATACADQYLWGRDILVAPVLEPGARQRRVYLPPGIWYDFWTGERLAGGRDITRAVDLATLPLYVRAGAVLPTGPVKQYVNEPVPGPLELTVYPGANGEFFLYDDDGDTFDYRQGDWMGIALRWSDRERRLHLSLAPGSRVRPGPGEAPGTRGISVRLAPHGAAHTLTFRGAPLAVAL
ncbi:MAG: TIM-barrel domain-containing protein [Terriglobales bacterium]